RLSGLVVLGGRSYWNPGFVTGDFLQLPIAVIGAILARAARLSMLVLGDLPGTTVLVVTLHEPFELPVPIDAFHLEDAVLIVGAIDAVEDAVVVRRFELSFLVPPIFDDMPIEAAVAEAQVARELPVVEIGTLYPVPRGQRVAEGVTAG